MNIYRKIFLMVSVLFLTVSCYEDNSTLNTNILADITVSADNVHQGVINGSMLDLLEITPDIKIDGDANENNFTYEWSLSDNTDLFMEEEHFEVISTERNLSYVVLRPIVEDPYMLRYKITNNETNFSYYTYFQLYVRSSYGEGIMVSYLDKDGKCDLGLIMDKEISGHYSGSEASVKLGIYSSTNGDAYNGRFTNMLFSEQGYGSAVVTWIVTGEGETLCLDNVDYSVLDTEMIFKPSNFEPIKYLNANQYLLLLSEDGIYSMSKMLSTKPATPFFTFSETNIMPSNGVMASNPNHNSPQPQAVWYDAVNGKFSGALVNFQGSNVINLVNGEGTQYFDKNDVKDREAVEASISFDGESYSFLMKDMSGNYEIYTFGFDVFNSETGGYDAGNTKGLSMLSAEIKALIDNSVSVFFMQNYPIMYIATATEVYAVNFATSEATLSSAVFSAQQGEVISAAKLFVQGNYSNDPSVMGYDNSVYELLDGNLKAIYIATNNGAEGAVYYVPMKEQFISSGLLDTENSIKYTGFGEILDISTQGIATHGF